MTFDLGGTLIEPHPPVGTVYAGVARKHGATVSAESVQERFRGAFERAIGERNGRTSAKREYAFWRRVVRESLNGAYSEGAFEELYTVYATAAPWRLREGASGVVRSLARAGYVLGVVSNADARVRRLLASYQLLGYFRAVVTSAEAGWEKPHLELFRHAERRLGARPGELLHVGDRVREDGEGARRAGWRAWVLGREVPDLASVGERLLRGD